MVLGTYNRERKYLFSKYFLFLVIYYKTIEDKCMSYTVKKLIAFLLFKFILLIFVIQYIMIIFFSSKFLPYPPQLPIYNISFSLSLYLKITAIFKTKDENQQK